MQTATEKPKLVERVRSYFVELGYEFKKISFPGRRELVQATIVVFVFTLLIMGVLMLLDMIISFLFNSVILPTSGP
jgi:preprotein translocase SecE subunit